MHIFMKISRFVFYQLPNRVGTLEYMLEIIFALPFTRDAYWLPNHKTYFTFCSTRPVESDTSSQKSADLARSKPAAPN